MQDQTVNGVVSTLPIDTYNSTLEFQYKTFGTSYSDKVVVRAPWTYNYTWKEFHTPHKAFICTYERYDGSRYHLMNDAMYEEEINLRVLKCSPDPIDFDWSSLPPSLKCPSNWCSLADEVYRYPYHLQVGLDALPSRYMLHKLKHELIVCRFWKPFEYGCIGKFQLDALERHIFLSFLEQNHVLYKLWEVECLLQDYRLCCETLNYDLNITFFEKFCPLKPSVLIEMHMFPDINPAPCCPLFPSGDCIQNKHKGGLCPSRSWFQPSVNCETYDLPPNPGYQIPWKLFFPYYNHFTPPEKRAPILPL